MLRFTVIRTGGRYSERSDAEIFTFVICLATLTSKKISNIVLIRIIDLGHRPALLQRRAIAETARRLTSKKVSPLLLNLEPAARKQTAYFYRCREYDSLIAVFDKLTTPVTRVYT